MKFLLLSALMIVSLTGCVLLRPAPDLGPLEQRVAELREWREAAIKAGLKAEVVEQIDAALGEAQAYLAQAREAKPSSWLDLLLFAAGTAVGAGALGAKAVAAAKWIHLGRNLVSGIESLKSADGDNVKIIEETMRSVMTSTDKALVRKVRDELKEAQNGR